MYTLTRKALLVAGLITSLNLGLSAFTPVSTAHAQNLTPATAAALREQAQQLQNSRTQPTLGANPTATGSNSTGVNNTSTGFSNNRNDSNGNPNDPLLTADPLPPKQVTAFQRFVFDTTGKLLPHYGDKALKQSARFNDSNLPVSADYEISAGDEILVRAWGGIEINQATTVDRDGQLDIPRIGTFPVAGVKARDLDNYLKAEIGKFYKNFEISATLGKLAGLNIYVTGQARSPGMHVVSSTSTLASVAFTVAQPGASGSYRSISLKRGGNTVATFDLYELLRDGELKNDRKLQPGDVILIGNAGNRVALNVEGPAAAIFEAKEGETLQDLVRMAGIDLTLIRQDSVLIEGFQPNNPAAPRAIEQLGFQRAMGDALRDGDIVTLFPARQQFSNAVTLKGNVADPARYPHFPGMRIADLIPNTDMLIPPSYFEQRNALPLNQRVTRREQSEELQIKNLGPLPIELIENSGNRQDREIIANNSNNNQLAAAQNTNTQNTQQQQPNNQQQGMNNSSLGNLRAADQLQPTVEDTVRNLLPQINWEYAVVERLNKQELKPQLIPFNLRKALAKDNVQNLELQPGDVVTIFSADDADIPKANKTTLVKISGEVAAPGYYQLQPGETIRDALAKAGGVTDNAYLFGTKLTRRAIQEQQTEQLLKALDQAERLLQASTTARASSALNAGDANTAQNIAASQQAYLERLRQVQPDGRVVLDVEPDSTTLAQLPPIELEDGDTINVPPVPGQVAVFGSVFSQGAFAYRKGRTIFDYLGDAGGAAKSSDKGSIFVLRANGTVSSAQQGWVPFVSGLYGKKALPGDAIYVPEDYERMSFLKTMLDVSTVFYQVGLGALAIEAIRD